jgi:Flp pilus assembly protein TadG
MRHTLPGFVKALWSDTQGLILPYVTIVLVVIIGVAVLAVDGARYMSLQTQLQNGADALALAGAAELDRLPDSETRAIRAINNLLANSTLFGSGPTRNVEISRIAFLSALPASDARPISDAAVATSPSNARFLSVTVKPTSLRTILPASFFGGANAVSAGASAVAGFDQVVCQVTPIYVCNPYEIAGMSYDSATQALQDAVANPSIRRRLLRLRQRGDNYEPYAPLDYGFLDAPALPANPGALIDAVASARPATCFMQSGVNFRPANVAEIREGLNVRFDIYEGALSSFKNSPDYRPSVNVRKGYIGAGGGGSGEGGFCAARPGLFWPIGDGAQRATGLLMDRDWPSGRMGSGRWDFSTYWQVNHGGDGRAPPQLNGAPASNSNLPSRYAVYRYEIDQDYVADHSPGGETGVPACYGGGVLSDERDRRVLNAAVVNCQSLGLKGAAQSDVPVAAFGKFFLILPLQEGQTDLFVEAVGLVKPRDGVNFDMVQLYR